jgi:paraquat-inducible protein B
MSKEPRYAWIGAFVVGAIAIVMMATLLFGRSKFFEQTETYISYFSGSVKGLAVGAPVNFRGAPVGRVKDISIVYRADDDGLIIPVLLELDADSVRGINTPTDRSHGRKGSELVRRLVERGLRAQLGLDSIVTGQLFVQLDFMPQVPIARSVGSDSGYEEIPTAPSPLEKLRESLQEIPIPELVNKTVAAVEKLDALLSSGDLNDTIKNLNSTLVEIRNLTARLDGQSGGILRDVKVVVDQTSVLVQAAQRILQEGSPLPGKVSGVLDQLSESARSLRRLADALEEHPEALLRGKR